MSLTILEQQAREKAGQGPDWGVYSFRHLDESSGMLLTGAVTRAVYKSGPRKGMRNWKLRDKSTDLPVFITYAERDAYVTSWEASTGKCSRCEGEGKTPAGWSTATGQTYRDCPKCGGSGLANVAEVGSIA